MLGERGYVMATLGTGYGTRKIYDAYRKSYVGKFGKAPAPTVLPISAWSRSRNDEKEARKRGELIAGYLRTSPIVHPPFRNPPGYLPPEDNARMLRGETPPRTFTKDGRAVSMQSATIDELIDAGVLFCGTPDEVYEQIADFCEHCGGMGNLLMMGQAANSATRRPSTTSRCSPARSSPAKAYKQPDAEASAVAA